MAATKSIRQQTFDAFVLRLQEMTVANGYTFDVGERGVFRGPRLPSQVGAPALIVFRGDEEIETIATPRVHWVIPVYVDAIAEYREEDGDEDAAADTLATEVTIAAMSDPDTGVVEFSVVPAEGGAATRPSIKHTGSALNFGEPITGKIYCRVGFEIRGTHHVKNPRYQNA